jgi:hypothetical protein
MTPCIWPHIPILVICAKAVSGERVVSGTHLLEEVLLQLGHARVQRRDDLRHVLLVAVDALVAGDVRLRLFAYLGHDLVVLGVEDAHLHRGGADVDAEDVSCGLHRAQTLSSLLFAARPY